jgi:hypothetical protein
MDKAKKKRFSTVIHIVVHKKKINKNAMNWYILIIFGFTILTLAYPEIYIFRAFLKLGQN